MLSSPFLEVFRSQILLSGGSTLFPGFAQRLAADCRRRWSESPVTLHTLPKRCIDAWMGGAIVAEVEHQFLGEKQVGCWTGISDMVV